MYHYNNEKLPIEEKYIMEIFTNVSEIFLYKISFEKESKKQKIDWSMLKSKYNGKSFQQY